MSFTERAPVRIACGLLAATLLCSVSTAALAAPHRTSSPAVTQEQLQQVLEELRAERAAREAAESRIQALTDRLGTLESATQVISTQGDTVSSLATQVESLNAAPTVSVSNGRPTFATRDGFFSASLRANIMVDAGAFFQDSPGCAVVSAPACPVANDFRRGGSAEIAQARDLNSGVVFRRARVGIEGRVFKDFSYTLITEFGGSGTESPGRIYEMWLQYNGIPNFAMRAGAFEPQVGLAANVSTSNIIMMERPSVAEITRNIAAGDSRIAVQASRWGDFGSDSGFGGSYMVAGSLTSSAIAAGGTFGDQFGANGRLTVAPTPSPDMMFHVGIGGSYVFSPQDVSGPSNTGPNPAGSYPTRFNDRPESRLDATRLIDTGNIDSDHAWSYGFEGAFQYRNFLIQGEYITFGIDRRQSVLPDPRFNGWYVEGSWMLTGERRRYNVQNAVFDGPPIAAGWAPSAGGYGAWELGARYSVVDLNYREGAPGSAPAADAVRGGEQKIYTLGVNWYLNNNLRFMLDWSHVEVDRLAPNAGTYQVPTGAQVGQNFDIIALRAQFGF